MKKNYAFALVAIVLFGATSLVFAQNSEAVEKMTGFRGIALRTYCSFASLFGAKNDQCFAPSQNTTGNTASVAAAGVGSGSNTPSTSTPTPTGNQGGQPASINGFAVQTAPQVIERTVIVQGAPGPQGPAGPAGTPGQGATGAFVNVPQVFWSGGGGNAAPTVVSSVSPLPGGALPGQVLTTNASGTVEWQYITIPSATNSPSILGSLANIFAENGLNLATTSTSTTLRLGGTLTQDTNITQNLFNFGLSRTGFGIVNQGTTTVPTANGSLENTNFAGLTAASATQTIFAGALHRTGTPLLFETQAFDSLTNQQGYSAVGNSAAQMGVTNGTTTNQIRTDFNRIRLSSTDSASSSRIEITPTTGVTFTSSEGSYSFPRMDGPFDGVMATDALGKVRFRTLLEILSSSSTSTLAQMPLWSTSGNTGTNPTDNFLGTIDNQDLVVKTNNVENTRFTAGGNVGIGTTTPNNRLSVDGNADVSGYFGVGTNNPTRPLTVVGNNGRVMGLFRNTNPGNESGIAFDATRFNGNDATRWGIFVNPRNNGDDRLSIHANGTGDVMTFTKNGDAVLATDTFFNPQLSPVPARLSVLARDSRPVAYFRNGAQTYLRLENSPSAFSQSYDVGVESAGGTFNIIDTNAAKTRLSINRNGGVQIYDRLAVGSYDFGLGDVGDSGFGNASQAYMRYVQGQSVGNARLELYDTQNNLSTVISQSSNGTATEFNRTNKDIDFRIAGQTDNNLFFADASTNSVGIGTNTLPQKLTVAGGVQLDNNLVIKRPSGISEILFDNTNGSGDFRIRGEANDLLIQGGGGRNLQLGAWHGMVLQGGLTSYTIPAFEGGTGTAFNTMIKNPSDSVGLIVRGNPAQTQDLLQLQNSVGTNLGVFTASGNLGLGTNVPVFKIDSVITTGGNNGFRQTSTDSSALGLMRLQNDTGAISQLSVYGSNHFLPELRNNGGVGASNDFYIYSDSETASGGTHSINFMTGGWTPSTQTRMRITGAGDVGIGTLTPSTRLEVNSGVANDSGFAFTQLNSASPALGTELQFLTLDASGKVILSDLDASVFATTSPAGVDGSVQFKKAGLFASNVNFNWDDVTSRLGLGTNAPNARLSVLDTSEQLRLSYDASNYAAFLVDSLGGLQITPGIQQGLSTFNRFNLGNDGSTSHTVLDVSNSFPTGLSSVNVGGGSALVLRHDNGTNISSIISNAASRFNIGTPCCTTAPLSLMTRGEDRLFITWDGKVAVGTTSPRAKFDVDGDAWIGQVKISNSLAGFPSPTNAIEFFHGGNQGGGNYGTGIVAGGQTNGTKLLLSSANMDGSGQFDHHQLGRIFIQGYGQGISFRAAGGMASTSNAFQWTVGDTNPAVSTQYERMVLTQSGFLGIGTNAPTHELHLVGSGTGLINGRVARFDNSSATCYINPTSLLGIQCSSDRNLKKDIVAMDTSLNALTRLKPSMYHWNNEDASAPLQYGFIAQEVEEVFPTFVSTDEETGLKSVAFGNLIPVTVKALQELNAHLGDLSKDASVNEFSDSTIFKRFTDAFKILTIAFKDITADKATVKELCLPKSDGTVICLTGDQVAAIAANAGVTVDPVVIEEEPVEEITPIDESEDIEPTPVEDVSEEDTPVDLSESPGNPAPETDLEEVTTETSIEEPATEGETTPEVVESAPVTETPVTQ